MNLLHVISSMDPSHGGPCQAIRNLVEPLKKLNVHSEVVSLDSPTMTFMSKDLFPIHALGSSKGPWSYSAKLLPWLLDNLSRFDAVIIHGLWLYHGYGTAKAFRHFRKSDKKNTGPKLFIMPHGMLDPYFQRAPERKLKALRNWMYWKIFESSVVNGADGLLFTCEAELLLARKPFRPYAPKREINVGLGIQKPPAFTPSMREAFLQKCPEVRDSPFILFLGRIHEKKGVDLLINAFFDVILELHGREYGNNAVATLVIAGPGLETQYGQRVQQLVSKAEKPKKLIFFPGMLTGEAKWGAFYDCQAFILPSHQENFGISVAEALATGRPVLISNQVNIWKEIKAAGGGIVADDTLEGVKNLFVTWGNLSNEQKREMGRRAQNTFEKNFAIDPVAQRLADAVSS